LNLDRTLIQIRERSFLDVLDLALVVTRARPFTLGLAVLVGAAPAAALNFYLTADPEFPLAAYLGLLVLEVPWVTAPLTIVLGGLMFGERPRPWRVARALLRGFPAMLLYQTLLRSVLLLFFFFYPVIPSRLAFLNEVILLRDVSRVTAVGRRCWKLCGYRSADLFGQWLAQLAFGAVFVGCFWLGTGAAISAMTTSELTWEQPGWAAFYGPRCQLAVWLAIGFFGVSRFFMYIDQRIRLEGWEVALRLREAGRVLELEGSPKW
jgi:hypothetical protein